MGHFNTMVITITKVWMLFSWRWGRYVHSSLTCAFVKGLLVRRSWQSGSATLLKLDLGQPGGRSPLTALHKSFSANLSATSWTLSCPSMSLHILLCVLQNASLFTLLSLSWHTSCVDVNCRSTGNMPCHSALGLKNVQKLCNDDLCEWQFGPMWWQLRPCCI